MIPIADTQDYQYICDWVELQTLISEERSMSRARLFTLLSKEMNDEVDESLVNMVWQELRSRKNYYYKPTYYSVERLEVRSETTLEESPEYAFCLLLSLMGDPENPSGGAYTFERLSQIALRNYLNGNAVIFGYPRRITMRELSQQLKERFKSELPARYNDRGVDVIGWKPCDDSRGNQIVVLMQCAGGKNWRSKTGDVVMRSWTEEYLGFHCMPVKAFSTPVLVSNRDELFELSKQTELLMDRPRLVNYSHNQIEDDLRAEMAAWCRTRLAGGRNAEAA